MAATPPTGEPVSVCLCEHCAVNFSGNPSTTHDSSRASPSASKPRPSGPRLVRRPWAFLLRRCCDGGGNFFSRSASFVTRGDAQTGRDDRVGGCSRRLKRTRADEPQLQDKRWRFFESFARVVCVSKKITAFAFTSPKPQLVALLQCLHYEFF